MIHYYRKRSNTRRPSSSSVTSESEDKRRATMAIGGRTGRIGGRMGLGMISHKMSLITIFGHKHFRQKFTQKRFQQPLILAHFWYEIANFEAKILQK